jgi:hypothetical protein
VILEEVIGSKDPTDLSFYMDCMSKVSLNLNVRRVSGFINII